MNGNDNNARLLQALRDILLSSEETFDQNSTSSLQQSHENNVPIKNAGDKIIVGKNILLDKKEMKRLIGVDPSKDVIDHDDIPRRQSVAGKNAFEIRSDIMQMAVDYGLRNKISEPQEIVDIAKLFYEFVENKRK